MSALLAETLQGTVTQEMKKGIIKLLEETKNNEIFLEVGFNEKKINKIKSNLTKLGIKHNEFYSCGTNAIIIRL